MGRAEGSIWTGRGRGGGPTQHLPPQIFSLAWSPDGKKLATVSKDARVRLYEPRHSPQPQQVQSRLWGQAAELGARAPVPPSSCGHLPAPSALPEQAG